jgi:starch phosphorylase
MGFARRFATYKRATLLFSDPERLKRLLNNSHMPVMIIFAGKAHPKDQPGQELIKTIYGYSRMPEFEGKIILTEGYDMALARRLVAGVDVWLNNPEYPMEASGTSGEKAGVNGVINLSVLDGWWGEGYNGENGWAIKPHGPEFDPGFRDHQESQDLLSIMENQVIPLYYDRAGRSYSSSDRRTHERAPHGFSSGWVKMSKASMKSLMPQYNSERMVMDYVKNLYCQAAKQGRLLAEDDNAHEMASWKRQVRAAWPKISLRRIDEGIQTCITSGNSLEIEVALDLDGLSANDIVVECLVEKENEWNSYERHESHYFAANGSLNNETLFKLSLNPSLPGLQSYRIRAYPYRNQLSHRFELGCMCWL